MAGADDWAVVDEGNEKTGVWAGADVEAGADDWAVENEKAGFGSVVMALVVLPPNEANGFGA
jgi:hypothetical protein